MMNAMPLALQSSVQQMQQAIAQVTPVPAHQITTGEALPSFAHELKGALDRVSGMQKTATTMNKMFEQGVPGISLNDVVIESQKAGVAFEMIVQSRNRLVSAYKDIMNMQV